MASHSEERIQSLEHELKKKDELILALAEEIGICNSPFCQWSRSNPTLDASHCTLCWIERARHDDWRGVYPDGIKVEVKKINAS